MKYTLILGALCVLLGSALLWSMDATRTQAKRAHDAEQALVVAQKRITSIQAQVQKSTAASQKARQDVKEKLDAAPAFRDTAVPVPVRDSLCERIRCK